jgi:hypothetical protein
MVSGLMDLYAAPSGYYADNLGPFDNMAGVGGQHVCAFTKRALGWLDGEAFATHRGRVVTYDLHALGLPQPPPAGRKTAVEVPLARRPLVVEARRKVDQFDANIPNEGLIVYEVEHPDIDPEPRFIHPVLHLKTYDYRGKPTARPVGSTYVHPGGVRIVAIAELPGGYTVRIEDPNPFLVDRTAEFSGDPAGSAPTACVAPGPGAHIIAYRATSNRLHELWRDQQWKTGATDLTANSNLNVEADGNPFIYFDSTRNIVILLFRDDHGVVRSFYWSTGDVGADNLSGTAMGAPAADGDPVGYFAASSDTHHVIYRAGNDLHELFWSGAETVAYGGNLTAAASASKALGDPAAFVNGAGVNIVAYRSEHGEILSLYWSVGEIRVESLSNVAGTPTASGDPVGYYIESTDTHQVVYVAEGGDLFEISWKGDLAAIGWNLSQAAGAPPASGTPAAYFSLASNTKHVVYRSADGRLHELRWVPGSTTPTYTDLTAAYGLDSAMARPAAFAVEALGTHHMTFLGTQGRIYELVR